MKLCSQTEIDVKMAKKLSQALSHEEQMVSRAKFLYSTLLIAFNDRLKCKQSDSV